LDSGEAQVWIDIATFQMVVDSVRTEPNIVLTFDDGNQSDIELALPALRNAGLTAIFFVVTDRLDRPHFLSKSALRQLVQSGMRVACHGSRHRRWTTLSDAELYEELVIAKDRLQQILGAEVHDASCPFGRYNRRVLHNARAAGYRHVYTSDGGPCRRGEFILTRTSIRRGDSADDISRLLRDAHQGPTMLQRLKRAIKQWR